MRYHPRNDWVLVKVGPRRKIRGLEMPEKSIEGKLFTVQAVGPQVQTLKVGDSVLMGGVLNETYYQVPGTPDLIVIKQDLVILVMSPENGEE